MEHQQPFALGTKRGLEEDETTEGGYQHSITKRPSFSSIYNEMAVSDSETPSGSPRINNGLSNGFHTHHHTGGSNSPRSAPGSRTVSSSHISYPSSQSNQQQLQHSQSQPQLHSNYSQYPVDSESSKEQFPASALLSLPPSILSLIPNSILKSEPISSSIQQKLEHHYAEQLAANQQHPSVGSFYGQNGEHRTYPPPSHLHTRHSISHPQSFYPQSVHPVHSTYQPVSPQHYLQYQQQMHHHSTAFDPNYVYPQPTNPENAQGFSYPSEQEWGYSNQIHHQQQQQMMADHEMQMGHHPAAGYQSPFGNFSGDWQSYEIDIANADPDNSNRFYLATQPNPIQRKCYKSEKRYLLPNPMIVKAKENFKNVIEKGVVQVSVVDEKGDDIGKRQEDLLSCNVGLSRNFSKGNTEIKYAIKLLENSGPIRFRLLFKVTYQTTFGSTVTETLYSSPFIVSHKTSSSSILLHTNAINSTASLSMPSSQGTSPYVSGYSTPNHPASPLNLQFNRMTINPYHQPHYNTPATSANSSRRSSVSSNRGT
eukprot:TRINITY_DN9274_c0_g1_i1.p1 TRINITY_DN9274_c0_g1~~TRINITY_DN9274_c0_g1_i1.p1  ORF type:complete len:538 (+),score=133.69 TRINITY_DN9274_c0_g1_i1:568-2181(+)